MKVNKLRYFSIKILYYESKLSGIFCFSYDSAIHKIRDPSTVQYMWSIFISIILSAYIVKKSISCFLEFTTTKYEFIVQLLLTLEFVVFLNAISVFYLTLFLKRTHLNKVLNSFLDLYIKTNISYKINKPKTLFSILSIRILWVIIELFFTSYFMGYFYEVPSNIYNLIELFFEVATVYVFSVINCVYYAVLIHLVVVQERLIIEVRKIMEHSVRLKNIDSSNLKDINDKMLSNAYNKILKSYQDLMGIFHDITNFFEPSLLFSMTAILIGIIAEIIFTYLELFHPQANSVDYLIGFYFVWAYIVYFLTFIHGPLLLIKRVSEAQRSSISWSRVL